MTKILIDEATVKLALEKIANVNAMDYEYQAWAKEALAKPDFWEGYVPEPVKPAQQEPDVYGYASRLATHLWQKHYMKDAPQWKPFDDIIGVLTQIDNMTAGLTRIEQPAQQKPVACVQDLDEVKRKHLVYEKGMDWKDPLYTTPQPAQRTFVGLTNEEVYTLGFELTIGGVHMMKAYKAIEAKLKEKNNG